MQRDAVQETMYHRVLKRLVAGERVSDVVKKRKKHSARDSYNQFKGAKMQYGTRGGRVIDYKPTGVLVLCSECLQVVPEEGCKKEAVAGENSMICPDCLPGHKGSTMTLWPAYPGATPQPYIYPDVDALRPSARGSYNAAPKPSGNVSTYPVRTWDPTTNTYRSGSYLTKTDSTTSLSARELLDQDADLVAQYYDLDKNDRKEIEDFRKRLDRDLAASKRVDLYDHQLHYHVEHIDDTGNKARRLGSFAFEDSAHSYVEGREKEEPEKLLAVMECRTEKCNHMWYAPFGEGLWKTYSSADGQLSD